MRRLALGLLIACAVAGGALGQASPAATNLTGNPLAQDGNHMVTGGPAPTLSSGCGTGATIAGTDLAANIAMGTSTAQPCTITFVVSYGVKPVCVVTGETSNPSSLVATNGATLAITSLVDGGLYRYHCIGRPRP